MKFTQIPADTFEHIQLNAGFLATSFNPATGVVPAGAIVGATTGGLSFDATPTFTDFGADIDNFPANVMEMKKIDTWNAKISGTFVTLTADSAKSLLGAADADASYAYKVNPRADLSSADFKDLWWIGDYSDKNGNSNGGFVAIHLKNSLSTGGFKIKSTDKNKGQFAFEYTAHYSMANIDEVPFEVYVKGGTAEAGDYVTSVVSVAGVTSGKTAITFGESIASGETYVYQTGYNLSVPHAGAILDGSAWTAWNGSTEITATTGMDIVVAIVNAGKESQHAGKAVVVSKA